jgi:hypothetical protein
MDIKSRSAAIPEDQPGETDPIAASYALNRFR